MRFLPPRGSFAWHGDSVRPGELQMWVLVKARQMFLETGPVLPSALVGVLEHTPLFPETGRETDGACAFSCFWSLAGSSRPGPVVTAQTAIKCSRYTRARVPAEPRPTGHGGLSSSGSANNPTATAGLAGVGLGSDPD